MSPTTLANVERNMVSPIAPKNLGISGSSNPQQLGGTVVQNERKHFVRKRVNTKTPNRKSTSVVISTSKMTWDIARELIDKIEKSVEKDQIKNCNMELVKNQIKVQLASTESANRVIESMQGKIV